MRRVAAPLALALAASTSVGVASAQAVTADVRGYALPADATALSGLAERSAREIAECLGTSARGSSETVLWLLVAPAGQVSVSLALHRGPAEGVGPCVVSIVQRWRLSSGARRRIELVLRSGAAPAPAAEGPTPEPARAAAPAPEVPTRAQPAAPIGRPALPDAGRSAPPARAAAPSSTPAEAPARSAPAREPGPPRVADPETSPPPPPPPPRSVPPGTPLPDVTVAFGRPVVTGSIARGEIQRVALLRRSRLERCYAEAVAAEPALAGEVVIAFRIEASGSVRSAERFSSSIARPSMEHCFVRAIRTWRFPSDPTARSTSVRLPLRLSPAAR